MRDELLYYALSSFASSSIATELRVFLCNVSHERITAVARAVFFFDCTRFKRACPQLENASFYVAAGAKDRVLSSVRVVKLECSS